MEAESQANCFGDRWLLYLWGAFWLLFIVHPPVGFSVARWPMVTLLALMAARFYLLERAQNRVL